MNLLTESASNFVVHKRLSKACLLAMLICISLFACTSLQSEEKESLNWNDPSLADNPEAQLNALNSQIKMESDNHLLFADRSHLHYNMGHTDLAIQDIESALALNKNEPDYHYLRGFYAYTQDDLDKAMEEFRLAAKAGSLNSETFYQMGQIFFLRKDYTMALKEYDEAIGLDSLEPTYVFAKGFLYQSQQKYAQAIEAYEASLELDSTFIKSLSTLHDLYENLGNTAKAKTYNDRLLKVQPGHPLGKFNEGQTFFQEAFSLNSNGDEARFVELIEYAIASYDVAIFGDPNYSKAYYARGYCHFSLGKLDEAIQDFQKTTDINPNHAEAWFMLGSIQEKYQDIQAALSYYHKAVEARPDFKEASAAVTELTAKIK